jgi:hypothetical protein
MQLCKFSVTFFVDNPFGAARLFANFRNLARGGFFPLKTTAGSAHATCTNIFLTGNFRHREKSRTGFFRGKDFSKRKMGGGFPSENHTAGKISRFGGGIAGGGARIHREATPRGPRAGG